MRYRFGPLHRPGLVAGFRGGQLAAVAGGLLAGVGLLRALSPAAGMGAAVVAVAAGVGVAGWPVAGRTAEEWAPDAARFAVGSTRRLRWDGGLFRWLDVTAVAVDGGGAVGVVTDRRRGVHSAVMAVAAPGFLLVGPAERDRRVADWAAVLASTARDGGAVHRLQWVERAVPDDATGHRADYERRAVLSAEAPAAVSYRQLLDRSATGAACHGVLLVLSVRLRRARGWRGAAGDVAGCRLLLSELATLRRRLVDAGIDCSPPLDPPALAATIGSATAPHHQVATDAVASSGALGPWCDGRLGVPQRAGRPLRPWPMAASEEWGRLRTDGTWHATYWVAQWPRTDVPADFLASLLLTGDVRRTVSVVMAPVGPQEAARRVERDRTAEVADTELRRRGGFLATARRQRQAESLAGREAELADGHAPFRFCAYVAVTADDPEALALACQQVEQAAAHSGLELRRCYGDQLRAFAATLPIGAGLP